MALIKFGGGITEMRGSIAGNTFSRNAYGAYVRSRTKPVNPNTGLQQAVRAALASLTVRWSQTCTAGQRTAWNLYGANVVMTNKLGESINLSGFNHYIRSNAILPTIGLTPIDDGPVVFEIPEADPLFSCAGSEGTQQITYTYDDALDWADENGAYIILFQGSPQNPQRNFFGGPWRLLTALAGVNGAPPASPGVVGVKFAISELQRDWVYARIFRADGRLSQPFRSDFFVGA